MYVNPCMVEEIISLMRTMKKSKSIAIDGFDIRVIDGIFDVIAKPLFNVFNPLDARRRLTDISQTSYAAGSRLTYKTVNQRSGS